MTGSNLFTLHAAAPVPALGRPYLDHPLDVAWDSAANIFVVDGERNPRIAEFDRRGRFVAAVGSWGSKPGEMKSPHALAVDASGNVYVADGGNARIQVFSNRLAPLAAYDAVGSPGHCASRKTPIWRLSLNRGSAATRRLPRTSIARVSVYSDP